MDPNTQPPAPAPDQNPVPPAPDPNANPPVPTETPDYLKGADGPPQPGQAMHPPGGYQAQPGETVQTSVAGGAVVQNQVGDQQVGGPSPVFTPPPVPQPGVPPQAQMPPQPMPQPTAPYPPQQQVYSQPTGTGMSSRRFRQLFILLIGIVLVILLAMVLLGGGTSDEESAAINTELENDLTILFIAAENYNLRNGNYPTLQPQVVDDFSSSFLPSDFNNPQTGDPYVLTTEDPGQGEVQYVIGGQCEQDGTISQSGSERVYAMRIYLVDDTSICKDKRL